MPNFLEYRQGEGQVISGEMPDEKAQRVSVPLRSPDLIAVNALGQIADHPRVAALREFITDWYLSYLSLADARGQPEAGPQERLSRTGDNLPNVVQFLKEQYPEDLERIEQILRQRVPRLASVVTEMMPDGRLLLQIKDAPFEQPILSRFASDGTLKMLAYLTILHGPNPPQFIGIEEPENFLYPHLLPGLAEECRAAAAYAQILISTHSPIFVNEFRPEEVLVLSRDEQGYTQIVCAADIPHVEDFLHQSARLGDLWMENYLRPERLGH
jgi:predicted ATPase